MEEHQHEDYPTPYRKAVDWIKEHKAPAALLVIIIPLLLIVGAVAVDLIKSELGIKGSSYSREPGMWLDDTSMEGAPPTARSGQTTQTPNSPTTPDDVPGIKVIEASAKIDSQNAKDDEKTVKGIVERYSGYVERSELIERIRSIDVRMTVRVPSNSFEQFFYDLRESTEIEGFHISDYRIELERRETQLETIRETIAMYNDMIEETREMEIGNERISLTKTLTDAKMDLVRKENDVVDSLQQSRRMSDYSTVRINIEESVSPKIWPENMGERFRENLQKSFNSIAYSVTSAIGNILNILITVIIWILYILVAVIPVWITYRILRRTYSKLYGYSREDHQE